MHAEECIFFFYKSDDVINILNEVHPFINVLHALDHLKSTSLLKMILCLCTYIMVDNLCITALYVLHSCNLLNSFYVG